MCADCEKNISSDISRKDYFEDNTSFVKESNKMLNKDLDYLIDDFKISLSNLLH